MNLFQRLRLFIDKHALRGTKATWGLFLLFFTTLLLMVIISHWECFHSFYISSLWKNPTAFFTFWLPKISVALFFSIFVLFTKRKWWTVLLLCIFSFWIIANILYFRANNLYITWDTVKLIHNLGGFESSVGFYWNATCTIFVIIPILYGAFLSFFYPQRIGWSKYILVLYLVGCWISGAELYRRMMEKYGQTSLSWVNDIPFYQDFLMRYDCTNAYLLYLEYHSMITTLPYMLNGAIVDYFRDINISVTPKEHEQIQDLINQQTNQKLQPKYNLIVLLIESFEDFTLDVQDTNGQYLLHNFHHLTNQRNVCYINKITSQARGGMSIDGQQICMTGILPVQTGAAAMVYGDNIYPNFAHLFDESVLFNPTNADFWNQDVVTYTYGFQKQLYSSKGIQHDNETFNRLAYECINTDSTFCHVVLTVDSHSPFYHVPHNSALQLDSNMPEEMHKYLTCLHYTDSCFGVWYNEWKETELAKNTVLVITGDHTIFKDAILQEFKPYAQQARLSIASGKTYCPLIIQAPQIEENIQITDVCYQMDVYPTIMHLIGCEDYYWKGFGVNLLDSTARHNRPITEEEAYQLSDKIIRADYFREIITSAESSAQ